PIQINERSITVAGVMPPRFRFPERDDLWLPYKPADEQRRADRNMFGVAVLSEGTSLEQAQRELDRISANLQTEFPDTHRDWTMRVIPFRNAFVGAEAAPLLGTLFGAVFFVLAIGCANLANLLLARGMSRQREMAIRAAIGASRARLIRQMIVEGLIVSLIGGLLGLFGTVWAIDFIVAAAPEEIPFWARFQIDNRVVLFALGVSVLTTVMFGLWPAYRASRPHLVEDLKESGPRTSGSRKQRHLQNGLVVAQVAMCMALLVGANMMIRSFIHLMEADAGFDDTRMLSFRVTITGDAYDPVEARTNFVRTFEDQLRALPGVVNAGATTSIPIDDGGGAQRVALDTNTTADEEIGVSTIFITSGFFPTLGLNPAEGRLFTEAETQNPDAEVAMISRTFAREFWPNGSAVGERIGIRTQRGRRWIRIVGVAPDIQFEEFGEETFQSRRNLYFPYGRISSRGLSFLVRAEGDPAALLNSVRATLRKVDQNLPAFELRTMAQVRANTTFEQRLLGQMMGLFAMIALFLACLGLYGVLTYTVRQRTAEIGIRMAIGASTRDVIGMVLRQGARTALLGIALGFVLSIAIARIISGVLYQVSPTDPAVFINTVLFLAAVVLLAVYLPARQASKIEPMAALRTE
ncbi:MAG: ABC transporter permease, partial [Acidobacteria bacterium]|nr:ABC transporter permease [Acidobacteriota bacterium]